MTQFEAKDPNFRERVSAIFERQAATKTFGISLEEVKPGEAELSMRYNKAYTQQNDFMHAGVITVGLDNACGMAAVSLMPAGADVLTVEFKTNLLAPGKGKRFVFRGRVIKPGRTITVCEGQAFAIDAGKSKLIATMSVTLMAIYPRQN